jgi:hypothetical protein
LLQCRSPELFRTEWTYMIWSFLVFFAWQATRLSVYWTHQNQVLIIRRTFGFFSEWVCQYEMILSAKKLCLSYHCMTRNLMSSRNLSTRFWCGIALGFMTPWSTLPWGGEMNDEEGLSQR